MKLTCPRKIVSDAENNDGKECLRPRLSSPKEMEGYRLTISATHRLRKMAMAGWLAGQRQLLVLYGAEQRVLFVNSEQMKLIISIEEYQINIYGGEFVIRS